MDELNARLAKAKIALMQVSPFISTICLGARHIITDKVPTAATNGINIYYNPAFIRDLPTHELTGLVAHECWHIGFDHVGRRLDRDPKIWNYAGDYVINFMLRDAGLSLPSGGLFNAKYKGWSTDQVYNDLYEDQQAQQKIESTFDLADIQESSLKDLDDDLSSGASSDAKTTAEEEIKDLIIKAHTLAKASGGIAPGSIPGEIMRTIEELLSPQIPWQTYMQRFLLQRTYDEYNWNRRNRRYPIYLPSIFSYGLAHLVFAIDTSCSVTNDELKTYLSEIDAIQKLYNPERMTIIDCDTRINNVYEINGSTNILDLKFTGGGGTAFEPVMDYLTDNPAQALVYFTDLYADLEIEPPPCPVLWVCTSDHPPAPFGETVYTERTEHV